MSTTKNNKNIIFNNKKPEQQEVLFNHLNKNFKVSRETYAKLEKFTELLIEYNQHTNLIGKNTIENIWERHIIDSLQLLKHLDPNKVILDFGSGAGIPGLILAITGLKVISVESIRKKILFQEYIKKELSLDVTLINQRIEELKPQKNIIITARAVAPLEKLFKLCQKQLQNQSQAIFLKGKNYKEEIFNAEKKWNFKYKTFKSETSNESIILLISELKWKP